MEEDIKVTPEQYNLQFHMMHLLTYLIRSDLANAKFVFLRIPEEMRKEEVF